MVTFKEVKIHERNWLRYEFETFFSQCASQCTKNNKFLNLDTKRTFAHLKTRMLKVRVRRSSSIICYQVFFGLFLAFRWSSSFYVFGLDLIFACHDDCIEVEESGAPAFARMILIPEICTARNRQVL